MAGCVVRAESMYRHRRLVGGGLCRVLFFPCRQFVQLLISGQSHIFTVVLRSAVESSQYDYYMTSISSIRALMRPDCAVLISGAAQYCSVTWIVAAAKQIPALRSRAQRASPEVTDRFPLPTSGEYGLHHAQTITRWIQITNGGHLKDDAREVARLGDGGWLSIQASRYHYCEPRLDSLRRYRSVEIGGAGVLDGPEEPARLLEEFRQKHGNSLVYARVPIDVAESYVKARGGIIALRRLAEARPRPPDRAKRPLGCPPGHGPAQSE
jgi:hypothetical protein